MVSKLPQSRRCGPRTAQAHQLADIRDEFRDFEGLAVVVEDGVLAGLNPDIFTVLAETAEDAEVDRGWGKIVLVRCTMQE